MSGDNGEEVHGESGAKVTRFDIPMYVEADRQGVINIMWGFRKAELIYTIEDC